jgi:zinc/manganese transport system permease protein
VFLVEPGFLASSLVRSALVLGAPIAVVAAVVGTFAVIRSQSFAGHALTDVATAGGAGATYLGIGVLAGFVGTSMLGAGAMDAFGVQRARSRDVATGIVLGAATGASALFLYLESETAQTGVTQTILFGDIFAVPSGTLRASLVIGSILLCAVALLYRPLLLSSVSPDIATARGIHTRLVGLAFMLVLAATVGLTSIAIGSVLSTALLIGPAATALRLTRSVGRAIALACALGVTATWLGILFAYDSFAWISDRGLPVSFFIVGIVVVMYLAAWLAPTRRPRARRATIAS